jgi:PAS domain S-box-containing protein
MTKKPTYEELQQRVKELEKEAVEHKRAKEELQTILNVVPVMIFQKDRDGKTIRTNQAFDTMIGLSKEEIIGKTTDELFPEHGKDMIKDDQEVMELGKQKLDIIEHYDSPEETRWARTGKVPIKDKEGNVVGLIGYAADITERRKAEEALQESEEKYRALFEDSKDAVYIATREGKLVEVNQSFLDLFCITSEEIPDLNVRQLYVNPDERPRFQKKIEKKGSVKDFEVKLCKKDRTEMDCLLTSTVWRAYGGSILGYQGIVRDITEHKRDVQALRERKKELKIKTMSLEEVNTALRVLLKRRDEDKAELEEKVLANVKNLVVPFVEKMKEQLKDEKIKAYLTVLETNLNAIISPFSQKMSSKYLNLTTAEIEVANLVKLGKSTKEIAAMLSLSHKTIETHRVNVRKKLGITNKRANLRTYLSSIH